MRGSGELVEEEWQGPSEPRDEAELGGGREGRGRVTAPTACCKVSLEPGLLNPPFPFTSSSGRGISQGRIRGHAAFPKLRFPTARDS